MIMKTHRAWNECVLPTPHTQGKGASVPLSSLTMDLSSDLLYQRMQFSYIDH